MKKRIYKINGKKCSKGEYLIYTYLEKNKIKFEKEKTFSTCKSPKNNLLRFDFYIPEFNLLIEYQGQHHYFPVNKSIRAKRVNKSTVLHDEIKVNFAKRNNIHLLKIPYTHFDVLYELLNQVFIKLKSSNSE